MNPSVFRTIRLHSQGDRLCKLLWVGCATGSLRGCQLLYPGISAAISVGQLVSKLQQGGCYTLLFSFCSQQFFKIQCLTAMRLFSSLGYLVSERKVFNSFQENELQTNFIYEEFIITHCLFSSKYNINSNDNENYEFYRICNRMKKSRNFIWSIVEKNQRRPIYNRPGTGR